MRTITTAAIAALTLAAGAVFVATSVHALWFSPDSSASAQSAASDAPATAATSSLPVRLRIPALRIDANIQYLGINARGNMQAPDNFTDVGWYKYGTVPGSLGSAVIDGHVDNGLALSGVFKHLGDLKAGDDIFLARRDGSVLDFKVIDVETYPYADAPASLIFSRADTARLNLITCTGAWVGSGDTYDHRLVVYSQLVSG